jgi:hypothetical protein
MMKPPVNPLKMRLKLLSELIQLCHGYKLLCVYEGWAIKLSLALRQSVIYRVL